MRISVRVSLVALCFAVVIPEFSGQRAPSTTNRSAPDQPEGGDEYDYERLESEFPLHWALKTKDYDAALRLIPLTADINAVDPTGDTPLTIATKDESADAFDMVRALLLMGADASAPDRHGLSPLHYAAVAGTLSVVHMLVDSYGVNVAIRPAKDSFYFEINPILTPLQMAYEEGRMRVARFLEQRGAALPDETLEEVRVQARLTQVLDKRLGRDLSKLAGMTDEESNDAITLAAIDAIRTVARESGLTTKENAILDEYLAHLYESRNDPIPEGMKVSDWVVLRYKRAAEHVNVTFGTQ